MTYRLRNIAVAVGLALIAALLTTFYVANYKRHVRQAETTVKVYVAKRDIPQGTPGTALLAHGWVSTVDVVQRSVVPGAISSPAQVTALITAQNIYAGEQITLRRFANQAELGVRSQLRGTLRAISIPGSSDALLAGTLRDGDHVDLLSNFKTGDCTTCLATRTVVRNLLVLRAPTGGSAESKVVSGTGTVSVLLAVSDRKQEQKVWYTVNGANGWTLLLRPVANATDSPEDIETPVTILKDGASAAALSTLRVGQ
jgi:Flp pilus assembly protein CpaB